MLSDSYSSTQYCGGIMLIYFGGFVFAELESPKCTLSFYNSLGHRPHWKLSTRHYNLLQKSRQISIHPGWRMGGSRRALLGSFQLLPWSPGWATPAPDWCGARHAGLPSRKLPPTIHYFVNIWCSAKPPGKDTLPGGKARARRFLSRSWGQRPDLHRQVSSLPHRRACRSHCMVIIGDITTHLL